MKIEITSKGDHNKTSNFLQKMIRGDFYSDLAKYGEMGVNALARATPVDSGLAQRSWSYRIIGGRKNPGIEWLNTDIENGPAVVILIQYGHGTGTGGYVHGRDFINPAMRPIFDQIAENVWKKVKNG